MLLSPLSRLTRCTFIVLMVLLEHVFAPGSEENINYRPSFGLTANGQPILRELAVVSSDSATQHGRLARHDDHKQETLEEGSVIWQLFNQCSKGFLQVEDTVNARGMSSTPCTSNFIVRVEGAGSIVLRHALTRKYVCFNRRKRVTMRVDKNDIKCHFIEKMNSAGYTMLESAWWPRLHLGFNHKGRFQDPAQFKRKYRCFLFIKLEQVASTRELRRCSRLAQTGVVRRHRDEQGAAVASNLRLPHSDQAPYEKSLFNHFRESLLRKVEV
uniref:Fibroblast growth factor n=1 Tax=Panagrellus redivivus TaxID=6233 RepID=A0A7E4ZS73_PANRE